MAKGTIPNKRLLDRMMTEGIINAEGHATALNYVGLHGGRVEDALIDCGFISEQDLLKYVSTHHGTRFVSTQKLYGAQIEPRLLALVPRKLAEQHIAFPVMYDERSQVLTVVTPDPDNETALQEIRMVSSLRDVKAIVGRPVAVLAAIARSYNGDASLFASVMRAQSGFLELAIAPSHGADHTRQAFPFAPPQLAMSPTPQLPNVQPLVPISASPHAPLPVHAQPNAGRGMQEHVPQQAQRAPAPSSRPPPPADRGTLGGLPGMSSGRSPTIPPLGAVRESTLGRDVPGKDKGRERERDRDGETPILTRDYLETVNVFVGLLENARPDLRGHSAAVARLSQKLSDRIGLSSREVTASMIAAHLHDIGKAGTYHLTALNVAEYEGHRTAATKVYDVPINALSSVALPQEVRAAVLGMYERFDGEGFPDRLTGKDIPLGARVLAICDTYADLTQNPRNPARKILRATEACAFLRKHRGTIFDPTLVDLLTHMVTGEDIRAKLADDRHTLLIVDPDPEETTVLELRLIQQGYDVRVARSMQQAIFELSSRDIACVVSEIDLDAPDAGLALRGTAISEPWGKDVVWVIHTRKADRELAQIVFDLGVDDFVAKSTGADVLVAKLKQLLERNKAKAKSASAPRGVSGSLAEMALPDMVQILFHGRKTCALRITGQKASGEIHFSEGQIIDARFGSERGEDAFYAMLNLRDGDFQIDPNFQPGPRVINVSPEGLLLEGMRRLDEGAHG